MTEVKEWTVRLSDEKAGYEIVAPGGEVMDVVKLSGIERPFHDVMRERIAAAQRTYRVKRFAELLEEGR
jgi:hypothetical protein